MPERAPYARASEDAVATTPRPPTPPTTTGRPRRDGLSRCSTAAKKASRSTCRTLASRRTPAPPRPARDRRGTALDDPCRRRRSGTAVRTRSGEHSHGSSACGHPESLKFWLSGADLSNVRRPDPLAEIPLYRLLPRAAQPSRRARRLALVASGVGALVV